eukprot:CAMPEP_0180351608 /NCGR_PEP_ID=MMETSP0989-20121125/6608_1 /TAXON_ID=697907 /ORGANISM="non described non described, Strain CCMP2293" /LENGTH=38 /DNA_ID= /DNA_START= /DNA_END= /DNA_ORIENTATION=
MSSRCFIAAAWKSSTGKLFADRRARRHHTTEAAKSSTP